MSRTRPSVRAVLVNFRCADLIEDRLRSGVFRPDDEVVIVDNASDPERVEAWKSTYGVSTLLMDRNVGFARAVNSAVAGLDRDRPLLLLNPDVLLSDTDLTELTEVLGGSGVDGVAPLLLDPDGSLQVGSAGGPLTPTAVAGYFLFLSHILPRLRGIFLTRRQLSSGLRVDWLCMACLLVRGDAFERFGPIPEDEIVYAEDVAWGTLATSAGARFALATRTRVVHIRGASGGSSRWQSALERLVRRRLSRSQAAFSVAALRAGLTTRRWLGRRVD